MCAKYTPQSNALDSLLVMLLDHLNTKLRCLNYLKTCFQLEDLSIKVTLDQSNIVTFLADSVLFKKMYFSQSTNPNTTKFGGDMIH